MFSPQIQWSCSQCRSDTTDRRKYCTNCHSMLTYTCIGSGKSGLYTHYYRHRDSCIHCMSELEEDRPQKVQEKQVAIQQFQILNDGK
jgi:threonine dehydrogenase-like Zn-dependent dehydrogenase